MNCLCYWSYQTKNQSYIHDEDLRHIVSTPFEYKVEFVSRLFTPLQTISPAFAGLVQKFNFTNTASLLPSITETVLEAVFVTYTLFVAELTAAKLAINGNFTLTGIR